MIQPRLYKTPGILKSAFPGLIWSKPGKGKVLYLTFDDGPDRETTPWILDCLEEYRARATFFCVGSNAEANPDLMDQIIEKGHQVGNHTYNHFNGWQTPNENYLSDVLKTRTAYISPLFRPPYGKITPGQVKGIKQNGYEVVMWDVLSYDFDRKLNPDKALKRCHQSVKEGSIIVFHDNIKAFSNMAYMLPRFLKHFHDKGFQFRTL